MLSACVYVCAISDTASQSDTVLALLSSCLPPHAPMLLTPARTCLARVLCAGLVGHISLSAGYCLTIFAEICETDGLEFDVCGQPLFNCFCNYLTCLDK